MTMPSSRSFRFVFLGVLALLLCVGPVLAQTAVEVEFFYSSSCGTCEQYKPVLYDLEDAYANNSDVGFFWKAIDQNDSYYEDWHNYSLISYPTLVISNESNFTALEHYQNEFTYDKAVLAIDGYLANISVDVEEDPNVIYVPFVGMVNTSAFSLPLLTVVLGALDSFNPCSFFVLIFLLNLLIYMKSRKRMMLVGGIFIFFSGLFYMIFMFLLFSAISYVWEYISWVSLGIGSVCMVIGAFNIKEFFFFKKGPSISIPDSKKPKLYKRMRGLVNTTYLPAVVAGAVFLAATVNFYELLCTAGLPVVFTSNLAAAGLSESAQLFYIVAYNIVYVIPLIIILSVFVYTLGKRKLSEWGGRQLELMSGLMIFSFGVIFLVDHKLLEMFWTPILLLLGCILTTLILGNVWKRIENKKSDEESDSL